MKDKISWTSICLWQLWQFCFLQLTELNYMDSITQQMLQGVFRINVVGLSTLQGYLFFFPSVETNMEVTFLNLLIRTNCMHWLKRNCARPLGNRTQKMASSRVIVTNHFHSMGKVHWCHMHWVRETNSSTCPLLLEHRESVRSNIFSLKHSVPFCL